MEFQQKNNLQSLMVISFKWFTVTKADFSNDDLQLVKVSKGSKGNLQSVQEITVKCVRA